MANGWQAALMRRTLGRAIGPQLASNRFLDLRLGMALMRDGRVPTSAKAISLAVGGVLMTLAVALEVPVEGLIALLMPLLGAVLDVTADGAEELLGTLILASLLLPHVAPRELVETVRTER